MANAASGGAAAGGLVRRTIGPAPTEGGSQGAVMGHSLSDLLEAVRVMCTRTQLGRSSKSLALIGGRCNVRVTLLARVRIEAEQVGAHVLTLNASRCTSFAVRLVLELHRSLSTTAASVMDCEETRQARCTLASFANTLELPVAVLGLEPDTGANVGLACTGVLHLDLIQVLEDFGKALRATSAVALLCIEELEALDDEALAALIAALHRCTIVGLPVRLVACGSLSSRARAAKLKPYSERLFEFWEVNAVMVEPGPLERTHD